MDDPIVMADSLVFVDAIEAKPGNAMRVQITVNVLNTAHLKVVASKQDSRSCRHRAGRE